MKYMLIIALLMLTHSAQAQDLYITAQLRAWSTLSLQSQIPKVKKDMIIFQETDFDAIDYKIASKGKGLIPSNKWRQFNKLVLVNDSEIHWRATMSAVSGSHVNGLSQGIGMSTMLIGDKLLLNAEVEHLRYNYKDSYYQKHYGGDKYRVKTGLSWFPTDNFSMHFGINHLFDK